MAGTILFGVDVESVSEDSVGFAKYGAELIEDLQTPVTWYLTGKTLERYPDVFQKVESNDLIELQGHTYSHLLLKTILIEVPEGKIVHGKTDWFQIRGGTLEQIDADLAKCQKVFQDILGRTATALTGPWCYYRGLGDRPDILEIVDRHGFRALRTFGRDERDGQPVPIEWQPYFYDPQGFPHIAELFIHDYQDDFYWEMFADRQEGDTYIDHLRRMADRVAHEDLVWSLASHDHGCATREGFDEKGAWVRAVLEYGKDLGIRFLTVSQYYEEMIAKKNAEKA